MADKFLQLAEELRKQRGLTYTALALACGEAPSLVSQMFRGPEPRVPTRYKVAKCLHIPLGLVFSYKTAKRRKA
ncbi:MAG: helix-turn-helix transcriptional regulator [Candidatus Binatia bacterium]|nr:helix-turn-helix transcriptional regulator [Candidatus Binatia bacterium]